MCVLFAQPAVYQPFAELTPGVVNFGALNDTTGIPRSQVVNFSFVKKIAQSQHPKLRPKENPNHLFSQRLLVLYLSVNRTFKRLLDRAITV